MSWGGEMKVRAVMVAVAMLLGACGGSKPSPEYVCGKLRDGACSACAALSATCPAEEDAP